MPDPKLARSLAPTPRREAHGEPRPNRVWRFALGAFLCALAPTTAEAQRESSWARLALRTSPNVANLTQLGKVALYVDGTTVHFFSGFHRAWRSATLQSGNSTTGVFNDIAYVVEPTQVLAFSAYRGVVEPLAVSPAATVLNTQRNDSILIVQDGLTLYTFTAFEGRWRSRLLAGPTPRVVTNRHAALLVEGNQFAGMSAFHGTWSAIDGGAPAQALRADGSWGTVETATRIFAFSAQRNAWQSTAALPGMQARASEDCILYWNATDAIGYTGLRHKFAHTSLSGATPIAVADALFAIVQDGTTLHFFSAVLGRWNRTNTSTVVAIQTGRQIASWQDGGSVHAYSPFHGTITATQVPIAQFATNHGVVAALPTFDRDGNVRLYSSLLGAFVEAPAGSAHQLPELVWAGALLRTSTGYSAFSGRTGRFTPLPASSSALTWTNPDSGILAIEDTNAFHVFEARREAWLDVAKTPGSNLQVAIWRTTLVAIDGNTAHGFGTLSGELESIQLPAPVTHVGANSESDRVIAGTDIYAFGATPDVTTLYQYPEFRRVYTTGSDLEVRVSGEPLAGTILLTSFLARSSVALPAIGSLYLDPNALVTLPLGSLSPEGNTSLVSMLPEVSYLMGRELYFQALLLPGSGTPYLSRLASVGLH